MRSCWVHRAGSAMTCCVDACRADGVPILRRTSGGGTVVVGPGTLNVTVILPESAAPGLTAVDQAQHYVLDWIARSIAATGPAGHGRGTGRPGARPVANAAGVPSGGSSTGSWSTARSSMIFRSSGSCGTWRFPGGSRNIARAETHRDFLRNLGRAA